MTLYRQLLIFVVILFLLLFSGTWIGEFKNTQVFLNHQLASHAKDTATSLGLAIQPYLTNDPDLPMIETMVNSIVDSGYYKKIVIYDNNNKIILEKSLDIQIATVPSWFVDFVPLKTPVARTVLSSGWNQAGSLNVESHPGFAYKTLWDNTVYMTGWFGVIFLSVLLLGGIGLRFLLRPLTRVEEQADSLCKKHFEIQKTIPKTRELRRVVETMNRMTLRVKSMFTEQVTIAERLQKHAYSDQLTGFGNRRYLESQVKTRMDRGGTKVKGALFILQIHNLQQLNQERGYIAGDELLLAASKEIQKITSTVANCALSRIAGGDFTVFLPDIGREGVEQIVDTLSKNISGLASQDMTLNDNVSHIGISLYNETTPLPELLGQADQALRNAQQKGFNTWDIQYKKGQAADTMGQQQWRKKLIKVIAQESLVLFGQSVLNCQDQGTIRHIEIFSRLQEADNRTISAGMFMPLAERLGYIDALDKIVLKKALSLNKNATPVLAMNMAASSLRNVDFCKWVVSILKKRSPQAPRLIFEFAEFGAVQQLEPLQHFSEAVRQTGNNVALDHFGQSFSNFGYLRSLKPEYVKIDRAYTADISDKDSDSGFFISSLCSVAHSLDIDVIAEGVETEKQVEILKGLYLDGLQGYFFDRPKPIEEHYGDNS